MYIKRYTIMTLIFIVLTGWYVYAFVTQNSTGLDFFGIPLPSISIAIWVIIPTIILYLASVGHMSFYSFLSNLKSRKDSKDYDKTIEAIADAYLGKKDRKHAFKTPKYELLGSLIDNTTLFPSDTLISEVKNEKISNVLKLIEEIKQGNVVELKKFALEPDNALVIQNDRNKYKNGELSAEEILKNSSKYNETLCKEAFVEFSEVVSFAAIQQYKEFLTKDLFFKILNRVGAKEKNLEVSNDGIIEICEDFELSKEDYLKVSKILSNGMAPEQRIKLFETLSETDDEAMDAYLFTLFDLEMLAPAEEILQNSQADEFLNFKAYCALKECKKHYNINLFV